MEQYNVTGMSCAACSARVEKAVTGVPGVNSCSVNLLTNSMMVDGTASSQEIIDAVVKAGYGATPKKQNTNTATNENELKDTETPKMKRRLIWSTIFWLILMYFSMGHMMWNWPLPQALNGNHVAMGLIQLLLTVIIMVINQKFFISGYKSLFRRAPNMDTLVALGASAAFFYSTGALFLMTDAVVKGNNELVMQMMEEFYFESAGTILTLITIGKTLEAYSKGKTTDAIRSLMKLAPKTATILQDEQEITIPISEVKVGDFFVVKPGEAIPVDGIVQKGQGAVNESALTGESIPVEKTEGSNVSAATINQEGHLICEATRVGEDTTLSQIIQMVSDAASSKAPIAKIADKVSGVFVPVVIILALLTMVIWWLVNKEVGYALARGISVLVISCPCALGLATPVAIMVGNGVSAKNGIMFKTATSLEETGKTQIVVLDKTGTITTGEPRLTDIYLVGKNTIENVDEIDEKWLHLPEHRELRVFLSMAYSLEMMSEHPLAKAIVNYGKELNLDVTELKDFEAVAGNGLCATIADTKNSLSEAKSNAKNDLCEAKEDTKSNSSIETDYTEMNPESLQEKYIYGGNARYISKFVRISEEIKRVAEKLSEQGKTPLYFADEEKLLGLIAVADVIKADSSEAVHHLQNMGIKVVMLTGDNEKTAKTIAEQAGVDEVFSDVLPDGKERIVRQLQELGKVTMVGDGINDAPALTKADIGIAIGAGTDIAIDAADVVLMKSSLMDVARAIRLSRKTLKNIRENLFWAFIYNVIGIPLAAGVWIPIFGWVLNPMFGAAAMSLSSFCVVSNALRLNLIKINDFAKERRAKHEIDIAKIREMKYNEIKRLEVERASEDAKRRANQMTKTITIKGMMCGHCEATVKKALEAVNGVEEAVVSKDAGTAVLTLSAEVDNGLLKETVEAKDFEVVGIE